MPDEHTPKHLRGLPPNADLSADEERELMDLRTGLDRVRRRVASEEGEEPWAFPVPRPMARLFDALGSPFSTVEALEAGQELGMDAQAVGDALVQMQQHELVSEGPRGYVRHPEAKNWF